MRGLILRLGFAIFTGIALAACAPTSDVYNSSEGGNQIAISGGGQPAPPQSDVAHRQIASPDFRLGNSAFSENMPFVRSQPERVAPFPLELNRVVRAYIDGYRAQPAGLERSFVRIKPYLSEMMALLNRQGLPSDLVYLTFAESEFSSSGAGPWQLSRATARRYGLLVNQWIDERRDPIKSTRAAAEYLSELHQDVGADWRMTLVAWNNGEGGVDRYLWLKDADYDDMMTRLPRRTRSLLNRFMAVALIARQLRATGQLQVADDQAPAYRIVPVKGGTSLRTVALRQHTSVETLRYLNPALFRECAPPGEETYPIRVPATRLEAQL